ncbi:MAG: dynamin family protein, partial [FCB group bacterium]|nr:dynamin family protein [FCB group bacterium]
MNLNHAGRTETASPPPRRPVSPECDTALLLAELQRLLEGSGPVLAKEVRRVSELSERLGRGRFHLAVLGQFKRGKSTLLNALLGEAILPTSVVPLTAVPTFLRWGETAMVRVARANGHAPEEYTGNSTLEREGFLRKYVTEEENPKNRLEVTEVEVLLPSSLLANGVVLIDTPGIGSTYRHNTEATLNFLPQCDAALFLVSADPPITEVEVAFLREVRERAPRLFFVLNKIDYLDKDERVETIRFLRKTLCEQVGIGEEDPIFAVSARQGLRARLAEDDALWRDSGLGGLEAHLVRFLVSGKAAALEEAVRRKAMDVVESALMYFRLGIRSLDLPLEELAQRLADFDVSLNQAYQEQRVARDILAGDKRRAVEYLEEQAEV